MTAGAFGAGRSSGNPSNGSRLLPEWDPIAAVDSQKKPLDGATVLPPSPQVSAPVVAGLHDATALSVDPSGCIYVIDNNANQISKLSNKGKLLAHTGGFGWTLSSFDRGTDITTPDGLSTYISDYGNHRILRLDRDLTPLTTFPPGTADQVSRDFGYPRSVAVSSNGALYISDGENNRIVRIDNDGSKHYFGGNEAGEGRLHDPARVRIMANDLIVVQDSGSIVVFDRFGNYVRTIGEPSFHHLATFSVDGDTIYALDDGSILKLDEHGMILDSVGAVYTDGRTTPIDPVDLAIQQDKCYILTGHEVFVFDRGTLFRRKSTTINNH